MPPPDPRSSTTSPGRRSARAVGLPQPRLAATASAGSGASCVGVVEARPEDRVAGARRRIRGAAAPGLEDRERGAGVVATDLVAERVGHGWLPGVADGGVGAGQG